MKSTFRILFYVRKNQPNKNGNLPIMIRITIEGQQVQFNSKLEIDSQSWDTTRGRAKGNTTKATQTNRLLDTMRTNLATHYTQLMNDNGFASPEKIRDAFLGIEDKEHTLINYFTQHNEQYRLKVGTTATHKTYTRYELTKQRVIDFLQHKFHTNDIRVQEVTTVFLEDFYLYIRHNTECNNNSTMKFLQRLRTVLNYARNTGLLFVDPFANYRFNFNKVDRDYLDQDEIELMYNKQFASSRLEQVRDMFIFSCYTGLSFIDLFELKAENVKTSFDGHLWIMTKRHKTNVDSNIRLLDIPKEILAKYARKLPNGKILPVISNQKTNDYLKEIAAICGINKTVTFHLARHTFATTVTLSKGVSIESVSKMLGHTNIRTTQIYARITNEKITGEMEMLKSKLTSIESTYSLTKNSMSYGKRKNYDDGQ